MKNWKKVIGVASAAAMTAAMMMPTSVFAADETFKIGVIGPMTGDYAQYGTNVYNAAKIAADEINENGGFNGYKVEILDAGDDQGDPEKAVNAYNDLIDKARASSSPTRRLTKSETASPNGWKNSRRSSRNA